MKRFNTFDNPVPLWLVVVAYSAILAAAVYFGDDGHRYNLRNGSLERVEPTVEVQPPATGVLRYDSPPGAMYGSNGNGGTAPTVTLEDWYRAHPELWYYDDFSDEPSQHRWRRN